MFRKFLLILVVFGSCSCSVVSGSKPSPVVYFSNASDKPLTNIHAIWAEGNILNLTRLDPGDTRSQSFEISSDDDFFGLVRISWTNGEGDGVSREFFFRKNNLPSIGDSSTYNYVQIYLEQNNFEVISSDAADLESTTHRRDAMLKSYKEATATYQPNIPSSLIRVEPIKDTSVPHWLTRSY
jgi:hypothetical protein